MFFFDKLPFGFRRNPAHSSEENASPSALKHEPQRYEPHLSLEGPPDAQVSIANRHFHYFAGNAYLGLQAHPRVLAATCEATLRYGTGTGTTRLALTAPPVLEVERRAAESLETEQAFYYISGSLGPQIVLETLRGTFDRIFVDEAVGPSVVQIVKLFGGDKAPVFFRHNDPENLSFSLRQNLKGTERPILLTSGVFSTSGKIAPLHRYLRILGEYEDASLFIDDSHGLGILGKNGRGTYEYFGLNPGEVNRTRQDEQFQTPEDDFFAERFQQIDHLETEVESLLNDDDSGQIPLDEMVDPSLLPVRRYAASALSKAIGGTGGIIAGSGLFIGQLMERSSVFAEMSPPPSPLAAGTAEGLTLTFENDILRKKLKENTLYFKKKIRELGLPVDSLPVPVVSLPLGTASNMKRIQQRLAEQGILIAYLPRLPGLSPDGALRIAIFATHSPEMFDHLIEKLRRLV